MRQLQSREMRELALGPGHSLPRPRLSTHPRPPIINRIYNRRRNPTAWLGVNDYLTTGMVKYHMVIPPLRKEQVA
jgi:hypothetical protein